MRTTLLRIIFACAPVIASGAEAQPVTLVGLHSCASYLQAGEKDRIYAQVWTLGYLSGWANTTRIDGLKELSPERVNEFLLEYCKANRAKPQFGIASAADGLRLILEKRAKGEPLTQ